MDSFISIYDVFPKDLFEEVKIKLKEDIILSKDLELIEMNILKTGAKKLDSPEKDWIFIRVASILRKIKIKEEKGLTSLIKNYSYKKGRGVKPERRYFTSRSIMSKILKLLYLNDYLIKENKIKLTNKSIKLLDNCAYLVYNKKEKNEK